MPITISLLRGINVGGHRKIKMAELRTLYESLGFTNVKSLLPDGMGRSKLSNPVIERKLKVTSTGRNWNTVNKLVALADSLRD